MSSSCASQVDAKQRDRNAVVHCRVPKQAGASASNVTGPVSKLHQAIRRLDPGAFETHMAGKPEGTKFRAFEMTLQSRIRWFVAGRPRLPVEALAAGETVSSNRPAPAIVNVNAATSDSISRVSPKIVVAALHPVAVHVALLLLQSTVSPVEQRKPKRTRSAAETKPESSEADLVGKSSLLGCTSSLVQCC